MKIHHICIQTGNYKKSLDFYIDILGFTLEQETKNFHTRLYNSWLSLNGFMIELQTQKSGQILEEINISSKGIVHFCLFSDDFDNDYKKITDKGYNNFKLKNGKAIYQVENGRLFKLIAPEGTIIEIRDKELI